jgi:hypothetical protein
MHQLKDIQGSSQILQILKHLRIQSPFQKMWLIALHWAQLQSGFHIPLLQDPTVGRSLHNESERVSFFNKWKYCHRALLHHSITAGSRPSYYGCCDRQQSIHSFGTMQNYQLLQNVSLCAQYRRFDSRRQEPY